jgi:hypothetical protein
LCRDSRIADPHVFCTLIKQGITLLWTLLRSGNKVLGGQPIAKRVIIVCPTSLVSNWDNECSKWLKASREPPIAPGHIVHSHANEQQCTCMQGLTQGHRITAPMAPTWVPMVIFGVTRILFTQSCSSARLRRSGCLRACLELGYTRLNAHLCCNALSGEGEDAAAVRVLSG